LKFFAPLQHILFDRISKLFSIPKAFHRSFILLALKYSTQTSNMSNPVRNVVIHLGFQPVMLTVLGSTHFFIAVTGGNQPNLLGVNGGLNLLINQAQGAIVPWNPRVNLTNPITNPPHWSIPDANDATAPAVPQDSNNANQLALGWAKLPNELKDEIIGLAMMAEDTDIHLPCLTYRTYKPNVAAKALRVK